MREEVFNALVKHIGKGSVSLLYASMVAANWDDIEPEEEYDMEDDIKEPDDIYEKYKWIIDRYAEEILNVDDFNSQEAFDWIRRGTFMLEGY